MLNIEFDNTYARELTDFYAPCEVEKSQHPSLLYLNQPLAEHLNLDLSADSEEALATLFSGNELPATATPIAQAYAGHQFGHFNPQLGDGRALILGEIVTASGERFDMALKGSGRTPFSRNGDGKAGLGPMLREVLMSEALHFLGIATTRSLAVVTSGEQVYRERPLPGAILTRIAASHIRIGTFEFFAARGHQDKVKQLADYTIKRHYPAQADAANPYEALLENIMIKQAELVASWMSVGFIHGVMNTDNMSIPGETIDYGPCAFMETYDPETVFSSIDEHGRYAYENQPRIAQWNLSKLAQALLPLLDNNQAQGIEKANALMDKFPQYYYPLWLNKMRGKLGILDYGTEDNKQDLDLVNNWLEILQKNKVDFTLAHRKLAKAVLENNSAFIDLFNDKPAIKSWLEQWRQRAGQEQAPEKHIDAMNAVNPWLIPRNHWVEEALKAANDHQDLSLFQQLLTAWQKPFQENPEYADFAEPAPADFTRTYRTFCGT